MQNDKQQILLLNPPHPAIEQQPVGAGLASIGSLLREAGFAVELLDAEHSPASEDKILAQICARPPRILMLNPAEASTTHSAISTLTSRIKHALPQTIIILAGLFPHRPWRDTLQQCPAIDFVVRSEGQRTTLQLVRALLTHRVWAAVAGIAYRDAYGLPRATRQVLR